MTLIPLQFIARASKITSIITAIIFGTIILLIILSARRGGPSKDSRAKHYSKGKFKTVAKSHSLENHHIQLLQKAIKDQNISSPMRLFENSGYLNKILQNVIADINSGDLKEEHKNKIVAEVFEIKQRLESNTETGSKLSHTQNLKQGQQVTIYSKTFPPSQSIITGNLESHLAFENPMSADGSPMKYRPGDPLKIRFIHDQGSVYAFFTKLREHRTVKGIKNILVDHSSRVEQNQLRKNPRREFNKPAYYQQVEIITEGKGRKAKKRAVVNKNRRYRGQIENIGRGGCALYSRNLMRRGSLLKINFDIGDKEQISVFGKVQSVNPGKPFGGLMHIAFTRISTQNLNDIQSYVHGFFD